MNFLIRIIFLGIIVSTMIQEYNKLKTITMKIARKIFQLSLIGLFILVPVIEIILMNKLEIESSSRSIAFVMTGVFAEVGIIALFVKSIEKE